MIHIDRTFSVLGITGLLAVGLALLHPKSTVDTGISEERFEALKIFQPARYDIVIGGDSRTLHGVSPEAMASVLATKQIFNFGFNAAAISEEYMNWLAKHLRAGNNKMVVLAITPNSLTMRALGDNNFRALRSANQGDLHMDLYFGDLVHFFEPYTPNTLIKIFKPAYRGRLEWNGVVCRFPDGWSRLTSGQIDVHRSDENYRNNFHNNPVSEALVASLLHTVSALTHQGIRVAGFRPPTSTELRVLENQLSGFDEPQFASRFKAAGGEWLSFPFETYQTCDGSHLEGDSAVRFSRDLATALQR